MAKPRVLRTHALVSLGAAVATLVPHMLPIGFAPIDPNATGRILQGILTGVGFLGAGVILRDPTGHVTGLTSAAAMWTVRGAWNCMWSRLVVSSGNRSRYDCHSVDVWWPGGTSIRALVQTEGTRADRQECLDGKPPSSAWTWPG